MILDLGRIGMSKSSETQIIAALKQVEAGRTVDGVDFAVCLSSRGGK
jgi:hypothetical protein